MSLVQSSAALNLKICALLGVCIEYVCGLAVERRKSTCQETAAQDSCWCCKVLLQSRLLYVDDYRENEADIAVLGAAKRL